MSPTAGPDGLEEKSFLPCEEKPGLLDQPASNLVTTLTELPTYLLTYLLTYSMEQSPS